ncbi:MAG TPA: RraA family protein [bacterium]|nr:RraA family protein [bacterium]
MQVIDATVTLARERLTTAFLFDAMDDLGLKAQAMIRPVRPLDPGSVLCGRARTGNFKDVYHADEGSDPYDLLLRLVDGLEVGQVPVLACGKSGRIHPWGGTQAVAAAARGAAGCVTDGHVRDVGQLRAAGLPTFSAGYGATRLRGRGRLVAIDVPVICGGVWVSPGDLIFGDADGVVVVPQGMEETVMQASLQRADIEDDMLRGLQAGVSLIELYRRYRVL